MILSREFWAVLAAVGVATGGATIWQQREAAALARSADPFDAEREMPAKSRHVTLPVGAKTATFAGGCFWGVEETFQTLPGVLDTQAGFTGGTTANPTYRTVHRDTTGHVEAVRVTYDPARVRYADLLRAFLAHHDGTSAPRHSKPEPAVGRAYRTIVFVQDAPEDRAARATLRDLTRTRAYLRAPRPLSVGVAPAGRFWPAEEYHQRYYAKRGMGAGCVL